MSTYTTGHGANPGPPPGFFHGAGGPRTQLVRDEEALNRYNFQKGKPNGTEGNPDQRSSERREPLNDDILDGCANLLDQTGKRVQVILRDGRIIVGELASVDHFSNLLLKDAVERIVVEREFGDIKRGIFIIRGDNIVLIGEIDEMKEAEMERVIAQVPTEEILTTQKYHQDIEKAKQAKYLDALKFRGVMCPRQLEDEF